MRTTPAILAISIATLFVGVSLAECNRGVRNGASPSSSYSPTITSSSIGTPTSFASAQQQSQLLRRQYMLAQQRYRQAGSRQSRKTDSRVANQSRTSSGQSSAKRQRLRNQNAAKALRLAQAANAKGNPTSAEKNYRKVIRIAGERSPLGRVAAEGMAELQRDRDEVDTNVEELLAAITS